MHRYDCKGRLNVSYRANPRAEEKTYKITVWLEHHAKHTPYYDVSLPPEAAALIRENLEWFSPHEVAKLVLQTYPSISANQVHFAWTKMSETLWKRDKEQLPSVKVLLSELKSDVAVLDMPEIEGVEQIGWVMKKIVLPLRGKIVEVGIDATCKTLSKHIRHNALTKKYIDNTNSRHLELYTVLGEFDNAGFPLSYCLLTTASSVEEGKRTKALAAWASALCREYGVVPRFVHTDKDMAEIGASRLVWPEAKHQLCWWHQREAIKRRLKGNLPTSPYNNQRAIDEYAFIKHTFKPYGRTDPNDCEGSVPGETHERGAQRINASTTPLTSEDPNSIKIRIPIARAIRASQTFQSALDNVGGPTLASSHPNAREGNAHSAMDTADDVAASGHPTNLPGVPGSLANNVGGPTLAGSHSNSPGACTHSVNATKYTIRIPAPLTIRVSGPVINEPEPDEDLTSARHTFCPIEHRDTVVGMMERHFCAHPFIPGYSFPSPEGIKVWAVKQMYEFCFQHDLPNLWAYLWENWYRKGRWELWARSANPSEIPRLKTTMLVEGQ